MSLDQSAIHHAERSSGDTVMAGSRFDLAAIEAAFRRVQANFCSINQHLSTPRDTMDDEVVANMLAGYAHADGLLARRIDPFAMGHLKELLELNALVLCGRDPRKRALNAAHLAATDERFYDDAASGIGRIADWLAMHGGDTVWRRAAGVYVRTLSEPQLFIEGNHRTGALMMSYLLAAAGKPPFVLTLENAKEYFDPSSVIKSTKRTNVRMLFALPKIAKKFARFLKDQADDTYLRAQRDPTKPSSAGVRSRSGAGGCSSDSC